MPKCQVRLVVVVSYCNYCFLAARQMRCQVELQLISFKAVFKAYQATTSGINISVRMYTLYIFYVCMYI